MIYGTNVLGAKNAQSMAIGYYDDNDYFFIKEDFLMREMNKERPGVWRRSIVKCKYISETSIDDMEEIIFEYPEKKADLTPNDKKAFEELTDRMGEIEEVLTKESLSHLRLLERFKRGFENNNNDKRNYGAR